MQRTSPATGTPAAETVPETAEADSAEEAAEAEAASATHGVRKVVASVTGVLIPVLVVGGIYSGILTLSEVAAALVAVVVLYGLLITRIGGRRLFKAARVGAERAGAVFLIVIAARLFSNVLVEQQTIVGLLNTVSNLHLSKFLTLLLANIAMLAAGTLMDGLSLIIIGAPILYSLLTPFGISPVHLAIIMAMNLEIGVMHPPLGGNLFAVSSVTGVRVGRIARDVLPYLAVLLIMLLLVTYVPVPGFAWN
jgi:C4-dicarboxylate transporter DctM subunit